jgi:hypothetical protein
MTKLGASLQFHVKHAADIEALEGCDAVPEGVSDHDWGTYAEVLGLAVEQAVQLLRRCRDDAENRLKEVITRRGKGAQDRKVAETWDTWFRFEALRKGRKSTDDDGAIGVYFCGNPPSIVPYVKLYNEQRRAMLEQKIAEVPDGQKRLSEAACRAVANITVTVDSDPAVLVKGVGDAFGQIAKDLAFVLQQKL